jgi:DNA-binding MarR family transcriptional regulator
MPADNDLSQNDYQALAEFRYQLRRFLRFSERIARSAGLEPQQHQLLLAIRGLPADKQPSIGELAERLQLQHHSAVELIDRTVERGLLERRRDTDDRRRVLIRLTRQGQEVLEQLSVLHRTELRSLGPALVQALQALIGTSPRGDEGGHEHGLQVEI